MYKESSQTSYREELSNRILRTALREFKCRGVKSVKMDDIANLLGISKRTLYEVCANKEELLLECIRMSDAEEEEQMRKFAADTSHSVIDIVVEFYSRQMRNVSNVSPAFFQELEKYDHVMEFLEQRKKRRCRDTMEFFMRGVREGYFRSDVNFGLVHEIGSNSMDYAMRTRMYEVYGMKAVLHNIIFLFLRGMCTPEGISQMDRLLALGKA